VTIYVRHAAVFTLLFLTVLVPIAIVQYVFVVPFEAKAMAQIIAQIQHPEKVAAVDPFGGMGLQNVLIVGVAYLAFLLLLPFVTNAVAVNVANLYFGRPLAYGASLAQSFRAWLRVLGTVIVGALIVLVTYFAGGLTLGLLAALGIALVRSALPLAILVFVLFIVGVLALVFGLVLVIFAATFALFAVGVENARVGEAISSGFRRIFNTKELGKASLMALSYGALGIGLSIVLYTIAIASFLLLHTAIVESVTSAVLGAVVNAFASIVLVVYYLDVRIRREGLDVESDLQHLAAV